jgi:hypothetical protein
MFSEVAIMSAHIPMFLFSFSVVAIMSAHIPKFLFSIVTQDPKWSDSMQVEAMRIGLLFYSLGKIIYP